MSEADEGKIIARILLFFFAMFLVGLYVNPPGAAQGDYDPCDTAPASAGVQMGCY